MFSLKFACDVWSPTTPKFVTYPYVNVNINTVRCMVKQTYMQFLAERSLCTNLCAARYCMPTATSRHIPMSTGSDSPYDNREQVCAGLKTTQARTSNYHDHVVSRNILYRQILLGRNTNG